MHNTLQIWLYVNFLNIPLILHTWNCYSGSYTQTFLPQFITVAAVINSQFTLFLKDQFLFLVVERYILSFICISLNVFFD